MKKLPRRITIIGFIATLSVIGITLFMSRKPLAEAYWLHQLDNESTQIEAARKLSELKCYRAIPKIFEIFTNRVEEDKETFIGTVSYAPVGASDLKTVKLHPLLHSVHQMGAQGLESFEAAWIKYWSSFDDEEKINRIRIRKWRFRNTISIDTVQECYSVIKSSWMGRKDIEVIEGPEKMKIFMRSN